MKSGSVLTVEQISAHLDMQPSLGLQGAHVELIAEHNHLIYRVTKDARTYALRMINPASYRKGEWVTMYEEFMVLRALERTGLGPKAYTLDNGFTPPFLVQEFVEATCYNDLKPLSKKHLVAAAEAIALLNEQVISPERLPFLFMSQYVRKGYQGVRTAGYLRLLDSLRRTPRRDVLRWVIRLLPIVQKASRRFARAGRLLRHSASSFHFDGAHTGNTYFRDGKTMFLDWQKVSWRNDPSFTLVRFATSMSMDGVVLGGDFETLVRTYLRVRDVSMFRDLAYIRLVERQVADLVWVLWDYTRRRDTRPIEEATSIVARYEAVWQMLL